MRTNRNETNGISTENGFLARMMGEINDKFFAHKLTNRKSAKNKIYGKFLDGNNRTRTTEVSGPSHTWILYELYSKMITPKIGKVLEYSPNTLGLMFCRIYQRCTSTQENGMILKLLKKLRKSGVRLKIKTRVQKKFHTSTEEVLDFRYS